MESSNSNASHCTQLDVESLSVGRTMFLSSRKDHCVCPSSRVKKLAGREEADTIYIRTAATNGAGGCHEDKDGVPHNGTNGTAGAACPPPTPPPQVEHESSRRSQIHTQRSQSSSGQESDAKLDIRVRHSSSSHSLRTPESTTPKEDTDNNRPENVDQAPETVPAFSHHPTEDHGSIEEHHAAYIDTSTQSLAISPYSTTQFEIDQDEGSSRNAHT